MEATGFLVKTHLPDFQAFYRLMERLSPKLRHTLFLDLSHTELQLRLPMELVQYIDVSDHRLAIHTPHAVYHLRIPLEKFKPLLPQDGRFFQCHRGILVNLDWVSNLEKEVVMKNGNVLPVSRRNYHAFLNAQSLWEFKKLRDAFS